MILELVGPFCRYIFQLMTLEAIIFGKISAGGEAKSVCKNCTHTWGEPAGSPSMTWDFFGKGIVILVHGHHNDESG